MKFSLKPILLALILTGCAHTTTSTTQPAAQQKAVVVWVSVDGFRPDYLTRPGVHAPFINAMIQEGAYTKQLTPTYPSLTFSSHTSEATGAYPNVHGIPGNTFFDRSHNDTFNFPPRPDLLKAEPIWTAAARQGIQTAVFDWPFSQDQGNRGVKHPTRIYESKYDSKETNETRLLKPTTRMREISMEAGLQFLANQLEADLGAKFPAPVSFFMAYTDALDKYGHSEGPNSPHLVEALSTLDIQLQSLHTAARAYTDKTFSPTTPLYFLISTDHGMSAVHTGVNLNYILKDLMPTLELRDTNTPAEPPPFKIITGGSTAHIFFSPKLTASQRSELDLKIRSRLQPFPYAHLYTKGTMPSTWHFYDKDRVGDLFLDLDKGYTFASRGAAATMPSSDTTMPKGMHAYDPATNPEMLGFTAMSRTPNNFGGINLGRVDNRRLAPTVATWLNISPPAQNQVSPLSPVTK